MQTKLILDLLMYDQQASMHKLLDAWILCKFTGSPWPKTEATDQSLV